MINFKRWTPAAKDCYYRGCICKGCFYENYFSKDKCHMKQTVIELVKKLGAPNKHEQ